MSLRTLFLLKIPIDIMDIFLLLTLSSVLIGMSATATPLSVEQYSYLS